MFSSKTKSNQSSLTSDVINTTTLLIGGVDSSLGYQFDASYNMNVYNDINIGGTITVNGQIMGNVFSTIGNPAQRSINVTQNPTSNQGYQSVAMGFDAGDSNQGASSIAIGALAGQISQPANSIVLNATGLALNGATASACYVSPIRNTTATNLMYYNSTTKEVVYSSNPLNLSTVGIGYQAGFNIQAAYATAVGNEAGRYSQGGQSVAIGSYAGWYQQAGLGVAVGMSAGYNNQGYCSVAIGNYAGQTGQSANSIVINASGVGLNGSTPNACFINPIRTDASQNYTVNYNPTTYEITYAQKGFAYYYHTATQTIPDNTATAVLYNTLARNVNLTGLTYSGGTFTNNSGATMNLIVDFGIAYDPINYTDASYNGIININVLHSGYGTNCIGYKNYPAYNNTVDFISTNVVFTLLNGENFVCRTSHKSGVSRIINVNTTFFRTYLNIMQT